MEPVRELRLVLTVDDFDAALAFYRDALGLEQLQAWEAQAGRIVLLGAGNATLELVDEAQATAIDVIEVGRRVAGPVRIALEVADSAAWASVCGRPARTCWAGPWRRPGRTGTCVSARPTECS